MSYESVQQVLHLDCSYLCFSLSFANLAFPFSLPLSTLTSYMYICMLWFCLGSTRICFIILINYGTVQQVFHVGCFLRCTFSFKVYFFFFIHFNSTLWAIGLWCNEFYTSTTLTCSFSPSLPLSNFTFSELCTTTLFVFSRVLSFPIFTLACSSS